MSTRSLNLFTFDGRTLVAYNHSDGYPSWAGRQALDFARTLVEPAAFEAALTKARALTEVDESQTPTPEQIAAFVERDSNNVDLPVRSVSSGDDWYATLRRSQGLPGTILDSGYIASLNRGRGGFDIEWAYEIDFDTRRFIAYQGDAFGDGVAWNLDALPTDAELLAAFGEED